MKLRKWEFENCTVREQEFDYDLHEFVITDKAGVEVGTVTPGSLEEMAQAILELNNGINPVDACWEDGNGNTITVSNIDLKKGVYSMTGLQAKYNEWRSTGLEESKGTGVTFTWDCGEQSARIDFSEWAELNEIIDVEEMIELENNYEYKIELTEEQTKRIEKILQDYNGSDGPVSRFWELYNEGAKMAGVQPDEYVSVNEYIEWLEEKYN